MIEGLWTAVFSSGAIAGAGIVYLADGQALGGDSQYFYKGVYTYDTNTRHLHAELRVTAFIRGAIAVFGVPVQSFMLDLSGTITGDSASAIGSVVEIPSVKIQIHLVKRSDKIIAGNP